jgi:hypothetical protein
MKKIILGLTLGTSFLLAKGMFFNLEELVKIEKTNEVKTLEQVGNNNDLDRYNKIVEKIASQRQTNFNIKKQKVIDIFVREDYNVLAEAYVVKQPEHWIKVLVKEKDLWY